MFYAMDRDRISFFWRIVGICSLLVFVPGSNLVASGVPFTTGFEFPTYNANQPLQNQSGWLWDGTAQGTVGHSNAIVQSAIAHTGNQAVRVTKAANSDRHWAVPTSNYPAPILTYPTQRFVTIDWDMRVTEAPASSNYGPFFGVDANDRTSGLARVLGSLGVEASTGLVLYQEAQTGFFADTGANVPFDQWNHFRLVLDFITDSYKGFVNGIQVVSTGFVDDTPLQDLHTFSDADIMTVAVDADTVSQSLTSTAFYDNFVVRDGLQGDYDLDGDVDTADYDRWKEAFNQTVTVAGNQADGNGNGVVDAADYVIWRNNLGASLFTGVSPGLGSAAVAVVPEPATLAMGLAALSAAALWGTSGRRREA
jgi:hypothetical protein